jgi:hypothetical protein
MSEQPDGLTFKVIQPVLQCRQFESDARSDEAHPLICQMAFGANHWHWHEHLFVPSKEVRDGFFIERRFESRAPISNQRHESIAESFRTIDLTAPSGIINVWVLEIDESRRAIDELMPHGLRAHVDDFAMGEID